MNAEPLLHSVVAALAEVRLDRASHEPDRGLQSAGTSDRPTRLEFSMAPDIPAVLRTEVD